MPIFFFNFASPADGVHHYNVLAVVYITHIGDHKAISLATHD